MYRYGYGCFAFGLSGDNRSALSGNEAVLGPIEGVLGEEVISQYKQMQDFALVDISLLPKFTGSQLLSYIIWKHLLSLVGLNGDTTNQ